MFEPLFSPSRYTSVIGFTALIRKGFDRGGKEEGRCLPVVKIDELRPACVIIGSKSPERGLPDMTKG